MGKILESLGKFFGTKTKKHIKRNNALYTYDKNPVVKEAFNNLATSLTFAVSKKDDEKAVVLILTSPSTAEGKSTVSANTAVALCKVGGKVLLIDADMRKPRLDKFFSIHEKEGLSSYLSGQVGLGQVIKKTFEETLDVIPCGTIPPNPAELLAGDKMKQLIDEAGKDYDYILIDTPPLGIILDALYFTEISDGFLMVVKANDTRRGAVNDVVDKINLAKGKLLGFVLNEYTVKKRGYYHYYKYGQYTHYLTTEARTKKDDLPTQKDSKQG